MNKLLIDMDNMLFISDGVIRKLDHTDLRKYTIFTKYTIDRMLSEIIQFTDEDTIIGKLEKKLPLTLREIIYIQDECKRYPEYDCDYDKYIIDKFIVGIDKNTITTVEVENE